MFVVTQYSNAQLTFQKSYHSTDWEEAYNIRQTNEGGYIMTGVVLDSQGSNVLLMKTDKNGDEVWSKIYDGPLSDVGTCVQQTNDSGYIIAGYTASYGVGNFDILL